MKWDDLSETSQSAVAGSLALFALIGALLKKFLTPSPRKEGDGEDDMGAVATREAGSRELIVKISLSDIVDELKDEQKGLQETLTDHTGQLGRIEGVLGVVAKQLEQSGPWAQSVEERFNKLDRRLYRVETKLEVEDKD